MEFTDNLELAWGLQEKLFGNVERNHSLASRAINSGTDVVVIYIDFDQLIRDWRWS